MHTSSKDTCQTPDASREKPQALTDKVPQLYAARAACRETPGTRLASAGPEGKCVADHEGTRPPLKVKPHLQTCRCSLLNGLHDRKAHDVLDERHQPA